MVLKYRFWSVALLWGVLLSLPLGISLARAETTAMSVLAEINGETITAKDLEHRLGAKLAQYEEQIHALRRDGLNNLIAQTLLKQEAVKRGMSVETLLEIEVTRQLPPITETEIEAVYKENRSRLPEDETVGREKVRVALRHQKWLAQQKVFVDELRSQAQIVDHLPPPPIVRVEVSSDGAPARGATVASVTVIEFSDYHCPYCKQVEPTLKKLEQQYRGKIKLVYRDFPLLSLHSQAFRAAEASRCAQDQGKFWEYHDVLFEQAPKASEGDLNRYAEEIGLDMSKFAGCLFQNLHHEEVQRDLDEGVRLGVEGTPTFFINGRFLNGAQPIERFVQVIDEELARATVGPVSARTQ